MLKHPWFKSACLLVSIVVLLTLPISVRWWQHRMVGTLGESSAASYKALGYRGVHLQSRGIAAHAPIGSLLWVSVLLLGSAGLYWGVVCRAGSSRSAPRLKLEVTMLLESLTGAVFVTDLAARVWYVNAAAQKLVGLNRSELLQRALHDIQAPPDGSLEHDNLQGWLSALANSPGRYHVKHSQLNHRRGVIGALWMVEAAPSVAEHEEENRLAAMVFDCSKEGMVVFDAQARIIKVNQAFCDITGYRADEAVGKDYTLLSSGHHGEEFYRHIWASLQENGYWHGELWHRRMSGDVYPEWASMTVIRDERDEITGFVGVFSDITEKKRSEAQTHRLAYFDPLTDLPNRSLFEDRLAQALAHAKRQHGHVVVLFLDLDGFKGVNDTLGHASGDQLLKMVAKRLSGCVREGDTVARVGGDEFTLIMSDIRCEKTANRAACSVANKLLACLRQPFNIGEHEVVVTPSMGVAVGPSDGTDAATLLKRADLAMYNAKATGKNCFQFYQVER